MNTLMTRLAALAAALLMAGCASRSGTAGLEESGDDALTNPLPAGTVVLLDGFEDSNRWQAVGNSWDRLGTHNLAQSAVRSIAWASEGETSALWTFEAATAESSRLATYDCGELGGGETDWTDVTALVCDIRNVSGQGLRMNAAVMEGADWQWSVSPEVAVAPGVTYNVAFNMQDVYDGAGAPREGGIRNAADIIRVKVQVVGEHAEGSLYIDNIRLVRTPGTTATVPE